MKKKHDEGFSLVEVLVAIVLLAAFVVPTCSALTMAARMNGRTEELMQAQLDVSSAVETLMAKGIPEEVFKDENNQEWKRAKGLTTDNPKYNPETGELVPNPDPQKEYVYDVEFEELVKSNEYPGLQRSIDDECFSVEVFWIVSKSEESPYYNVTAISRDGLVKVETSIRIGGGS